MANKSAFPLLLGAGALALLVSGGKKKSRTKDPEKGPEYWSAIHGMLIGHGYATGTGGADKHPSKASVMQFQKDWNLVRDRMLSGKLTELPGIRMLGQLSENGQIDPNTVTALSMIKTWQEDGKMNAAWLQVVGTAKNI